MTVHWEPISLFLKNDPAQDSQSFERYQRTHNLLRVMESVRHTDGNEGVFHTYWDFASRHHHDSTRDFDVREALSGLNLDPSHADAFHDAHWDAEIRRRMDVGLALAGEDIGTPIIGFDNAAGERVGIFGPVITRIPDPQQSLQLWDGMIAVTTVPGFWELKRTRTERPDLGERPAGRPPKLGSDRASTNEPVGQRPGIDSAG